MANIIALYRGDDLAHAQLVTVTADPAVVDEFTRRLLAQPRRGSDPVLTAVENGRRQALRLVQREAAGTR